MIGRTISHYKILDQIGEGGMGVVYRAEDTRLARLVALKFLPAPFTADASARARFVNEARAVSGLNHSSIAVVHDIGETAEGQMFIVMAYYDGGTLQERIESGPLPVNDAVRVVRQVASGLARAHAAGVIHRDVKPANILITQDGEARLSDFGLARLAGTTRITQAGSTMGTAHYMSPEQARGDEVDQRSDIFSLGTVLYQALTGQLPFRGEHAAAVLYNIVNTDPAPLPASTDIPPALASILDRMLAKQVEERYASADDVVRDLDVLQSGGVSVSRPRRDRARRRLAIALAALALVGVAAVVWKTRPHRAEPEIVMGPSEAIAVLPFRNLSGDPARQWMEDAVPEMLNAALSRSADLRVLDRLRLVEILRELGRETTGRIEEADAMAMARRARVGTLITGEIVGAGPTIRVQCNVVEAPSGRLLHSEIVEGTEDDDVFKMVAQLTDELQTYLHIQAISENVDEAWVRDVTSRSLDAFRHYVRGRSLLMSSQWAEARTEFEAAIAADSNLVMAYVDLTGACFNLEDYPCIGAAYQHALRLRPRAAPREQLNIDLVGAIINDENEQQVRIASELLQSDPEGAFWRYILGRGYYFSGRYQQAVDAWQPLYARRWKWVWTNIYMSDALCQLHRFDEALAVLAPGWELVEENRPELRAVLFRFRGRIYRDRGEYALALADFDTADRLRPGYEMVKYDRGLLAQKQGRHDEAARMYRAFLGTGIKAPEIEDAKQRLATLQ